MSRARLSTELIAVVVTVADGSPMVLASGEPLHLPSGPLSDDQLSLQAAVRQFAAEQSGHTLGYIEQLYTFADPHRAARESNERAISIAYLGLTHAQAGPGWVGIYDLMPWENARVSGPIVEEILGRLVQWADGDAARIARIDYLWGRGEQPWRPELALHRYELLWEAGEIPEADGAPSDPAVVGVPMWNDHRRMVATALSRVRSTIQYRPLLFELVPETFTLGQLQQVVEALSGTLVHTQNFRRLIETQHQLVEPTGEVRSTGGRPARLYRFRSELMSERQHVGTKLPIPRNR